MGNTEEKLIGSKLVLVLSSVDGVGEEVVISTVTRLVTKNVVLAVVVVEGLEADDDVEVNEALTVEDSVDAELSSPDAELLVVEDSADEGLSSLDSELLIIKGSEGEG